MKAITSFLSMVFFAIATSLVQTSFAGDETCFGYTSNANPFFCYDHGNCVWWAAYKRPDLKAFMSGNANQWYGDAVSRGFDVGSNPRVGAVAVFGNGTYGHVNYSEAVNQEVVFGASEMDYYGTFGNGLQYGVYRPSGDRYTRNNGPASWRLIGFIYPRYCLYLNASEGAFCWNGNDGHFAECADGHGYARYKSNGNGSLATIPLTGEQGASYCDRLTLGEFPQAYSVDLGAYKGGNPAYAVYGGFGYGNPNGGEVISSALPYSVGGDTTPSGSNPSPLSGKRSDLTPDFDVYHEDGHEISSNCNNCETEAVHPMQRIKSSLEIEVSNNDASKSLRKNSKSIEGPIWWRLENNDGTVVTDWALLGSPEYAIDRLKKGRSPTESIWSYIPDNPGLIFALKTCVDGDDEIWEEGESSTRRKATSPDNCGTNNASRKEKFLILPEIEPDPLPVTPLDRFVPCSVITADTWSRWSSLGFAAPFDDQGALLIQTECNAAHMDGIDVHFGVSKDPNVWVYAQAYIRNVSTGTYDTRTVLCQDENLANGWCRGSGYLGTSGQGIDTSDVNNPMIVLGYVCTSYDGQMKCPPNWQGQGGAIAQP